MTKLNAKQRLLAADLRDINSPLRTLIKTLEASLERLKRFDDKVVTPAIHDDSKLDLDRVEFALDTLRDFVITDVAKEAEALEKALDKYIKDKK